MNLYRKYRPQSFKEMLGNRVELESLEIALNKKDRPHVYLFVGPAGCGKTTAARISAQMVGAQEMSIFEINSSNNRGIDTARSIIDKMEYAPIDGDAVVFIMDEMHRAMVDHMNAMLKPLEDTPEHVFFFLCTTDPQKLIPALKSRCSIFQFPALEMKFILRILKKVSRAEGIGISDELLEEIVDRSEGSPRRALVLLEKVAGLEDEEKMRSLIVNEMDEEEMEDVIQLCRALMKGNDWKEVAERIKASKELDMEKTRRAVLGYMNAVLLSGKRSDRAALVLEYFSEPFYNTGKAGLVLACYQVLFSEIK